MYAWDHPCEKPRDVDARKRRYAASHAGDEDDDDDARRTGARPRHSPALSGWAWRRPHLFHSRSKSASGTKPYLWPYHSMSIESFCAALSVHGSPTYTPCRLIVVWSSTSFASVGT